MACTDTYDIQPVLHKSENLASSFEMQGPGGCVSMDFCLEIQGLIQSDPTTVDNCVNDRTRQLAVSPSAGDNGPMVADISLLDPDGCFDVISGLLAITKAKNSNDVAIEYYFRVDDTKYVLKVAGVVPSDDWLPTMPGESATVDLGGQSWEIKVEGSGKGKKGKNACVSSGVIPDDAQTLISVQNGSCAN